VILFDIRFDHIFSLIELKSVEFFPKIGVRNPHPKVPSLLSQERVRLRNSNLAGTFMGCIRTKAR